MTTPRAAAFDIEEQLAVAFERIADLGRQLAHAREESADREATVRALRESWNTVEGRTLRHEASLDAVRALGTTVAALEERLEQESQLRREALLALGQGVARDRGAAGAVVEHLEELESRLDDARRVTAGAGARGRTQGDALGEIDERLARAHERLDGVEQRLAADRDAAVAATSQHAGLEARVAESAAVLRELVGRTREGQNERRALADSVAELQAADRQDGELRDLLDQQRAMRQRLEERLMALEDEMRAVGRAMLEAAEQRAQIRVQLANLDARVGELTVGEGTDRELVAARFRALAELEERSERRVAAELEQRARERRETLNRLDEATEQATRGVPL